MLHLAVCICTCEIEEEPHSRLASWTTDPDGPLAVAAMRYTVKPCPVDSVTEDSDDGVANVDCRVPNTGTLLDSGRPTEDSYISTSMATDERQSLLHRSPPDIMADSFVVQPSSVPMDIGENWSDLDDATDQRASVNVSQLLQVDPPENESKTDSCVGGGTLSLINESIHPGGQRTLADRGRKYANRQRRRLVFKDGSCNISSRNVMSRKRKYLVDIFTTMVDMRWRYSVLMFTAAFVVSWFAFSVVWFLIALVHGDTEHADDDDWKSCAAHVYDFPTALLFSIESQTTIGYGYRVVEPYCVVSFFVLMIQSCVGVFIQSLMTGVIFAKLSRPKQRAHTLLFSKTAVVCKRDMQYCLLFRVGDMRKSHIIGTSIRAVMVKDRHTKEGEVIPLCQFPLDVQTETCNTADNFVFLVWPVTVMHKIDSSSPLWDISAERLYTERFEIVVILEGVVESTGGTTQVRTSYLPSEILWGHRLAPLLTYQKENGQYRIDYSQFHAVEPIKMPECSAKQLAASERRLADENDDDDHVYFTSTSAKMSATSGGRMSLIRRMRSSVRRRRNRSRLDLTGNNSIDMQPTGDDVIEAQRPVSCNGDDAVHRMTVPESKSCGHINSVTRSISFA